MASKITSTTDSKKKNPSNTSAAHDLMQPRIDLVNTLMEGTPALIAAKETYLPRHEVESERNYEDRLQRSILTNYFRRSVESMVGKPFAQPLVVGDDMPQALVELSEDIDHQGNSINVFGRKVFRDALAKGLTHILVEFPNTADAGVKTAEDEVAVNATPYFVHIPPESILAAYCDYRNGQAFITHVRIYEVTTEQDQFSEIEVERIRILEPGTWEVWRKGEKKWFREASGVTSLDYVPLVTFYADKEDFMVGRPPLLDLAYVNLKHFQSSSDQANAMTVARFPILAGSGLNEEESNIKLGPKQLLTAVNKDGKFYYVEHTGAAIEAGRNELKDLEEQMSILGIELLKKSGDATATAKAIDTAENLSMLQSLTLVFSDALEEAYRIAADWMSITKQGGGSITINTDFGLKMDDITDLTSLQWARQNGEISHEQYLRELQRRGTLADDFDAEQDQLLLDSEKQKKVVDQAFQQSLVNEGILPGAPPVPPLKVPAPAVGAPTM